jgi:ParB/RepB/Spo0J family partition protein
MTLYLSGLSDISALLSAQNKGNGLRSVRVDAIRPDPNQPRKSFDEASLTELAESIRAVGIIQPPVVSSQGEGYLLISGERRWRAAHLLGLERIDVIVRDDLEARAQIVENIQRDALSAWEIYRWITSELDAGAKQNELAAAIGKSKQWVSAYASIAKMPESLITALRENRIEDITALGHLCRLQKELPEEATRLLRSCLPITRKAVAGAFVEASASHSDTDGDAQTDASSRYASNPAEPPDKVSDGISRDVNERAAPAVVSEASPLLPVRITAYYDGQNWLVNYAEQDTDTNGARIVKIEGEDGAVRYAPLGRLRLQSIERG